MNYIDEFFQLDPIFRLLFSVAYVPFAAGLLVKIWQAHDINYIHIMEVSYKDRMNPYQLWKIASMIAFCWLTVQYLSLQEISAIYEDQPNVDFRGAASGEEPVTAAGRTALTAYKQVIGIAAVVLQAVLWLNPARMLYRRLRFGVFSALGNVVTAPFGGVHFKAYLLAEILTDCTIQLEDIGKVTTYLLLGNWDLTLVSASQSQTVGGHTPPAALKWWLYFVSFIGAWFRMQQNLKKWLVYDHGEQAFNALKYFFLVIGPVCAIVYYETHIKPFKYMYYTFKAIGSAFKVFWDFYFDWGLFRGTEEHNRFLRDEMKFAPAFYYTCMVFDVIGLFFWAIVIGLYEWTTPENTNEAIGSLEFFNNVMWITWAELIVMAVRRTVWILIRLENEYFNNFESFRDIVTVPPIKKAH